MITWLDIDGNYGRERLYEVLLKWRTCSAPSEFEVPEELKRLGGAGGVTMRELLDLIDPNGFNSWLLLKIWKRLEGLEGKL